MDTKEEQVLLSVLCVTYNAEDYIEECLNSISSQDINSFEIIVSDDCSTDSTWERILERSRQCSLIKAFRNEKNLGITRNCNKGLSYCKGKYVALFAGDDVMLPGKLKSQIDLMEQDDSSALSFHWVEHIDEKGSRLGIARCNARKYKDYRDIFTRKGLPFTGSVVARRSMMPEKGYCEEMELVSDWQFLIETAINGSIVMIPEVYSQYRRHTEGQSNKASRAHEELLLYADRLYQSGRVNRAELYALRLRAAAGQIRYNLKERVRSRSGYSSITDGST